jgi:SAM-dependent methyltransferase
MNPFMSTPESKWSRAAVDYEKEFINPYLPEVRNPLKQVLRRLAAAGRRTVADLGCGIGPLLPFLAEQFQEVIAVDFAEGMLARARERCRSLANLTFLQRDLSDLAPLAGRLDVAVAVNSLVMPEIPTIEKSLRQIRASLKPGGVFLAILPAMDAVHYYTMLLLDRALSQGKTLDAARKNAAHFGDHEYFDFAFGQFNYKGIEQHFWQPFEIRYRLRRAGFQRIRLRRVFLAWKQFAFWKELKEQRPPWDWYVRAVNR